MLIIRTFICNLVASRYTAQALPATDADPFRRCQDDIFIEIYIYCIFHLFQVENNITHTGERNVISLNLPTSPYTTYALMIYYLLIANAAYSRCGPLRRRQDLCDPVPRWSVLQDRVRSRYSACGARVRARLARRCWRVQGTKCTEMVVYRVTVERHSIYISILKLLIPACVCAWPGSVGEYKVRNA